MPLLQPAEVCCGTCPIVKGVQILASYTVVVGMFSVLSLLMQRPPDDKPVASDTMQAVEFIAELYHTLSFFAGLKGLIGIMLRDARRLRVLLLYHIGDLVMRTVKVIFREIEACEELKRLQQLHKAGSGDSAEVAAAAELGKVDCQSARMVFFVEYVLRIGMYAYFTYVIWSLIYRLESGDMSVRRGGLDDLEAELADRSGLGDSWFVSGGDATNALLQRGPLTAPLNEGGQGRRGAPGAPRPFSGEPRNLSEQGEQSPGAPFQGTPHRLE